MHTPPTKKSQRPELLAPAGRLDVLDAVLTAGADAAYVSGKRFNMRRHRRDFHFADGELATAVATAHGLGRRLYVTVNALLGQDEMAPLRDYLQLLATLSVDAIIVQDLAVVKLVRELGLRLPLHASTMMNVSCAAAAMMLREWGFTRAVTSRDITLEAVRRLRQESGLEVEYFLHGDLCSVLSGRCLSSGIIFGKSANRGQCMKPCRWAYDLWSEGSGQKVRENVFLLASRDLCLLQHLPELVEAGVDSLKIEGRMRPAETLAPIVAAYRQAIDRTVAEPLAAAKLLAEGTDRQRARTRDLTTGFAFRHPDDSFMGVDGEREPLVFSTHGRVRALADAELPEWPAGLDLRTPQRQPGLSVVVGTVAGAEAALAAPCDWLLLSWEGNLTPESGWTLGELAGLVERARAAGVPALLCTPRVVDGRSAGELRQVVEAGLGFAGFVVTEPAALGILAGVPGQRWAEATMNVLNAEAANWLRGQGVTRIMPALEASLAEIAALIAAAPACEFDLLAHGPLTGMLVEHCLIAMHTQGGSKTDFCRMPCAVDQFSLVDRQGNRRRIHADRYCRNHLMLEADLATLPHLDRLLALGPASLRLDGRIYPPEMLTTLIASYRQTLAEPDQGAALLAQFERRYPSSRHTLGAYPLGICRDEEISRLDLKREEHREC